MMNPTGIADFVSSLTTENLQKLRAELQEKLLTNTRYISLGMGGKNIAQTELVDSGLLMGIVAQELRRRGLTEHAAPKARTVARFL